MSRGQSLHNHCLARLEVDKLACQAWNARIIADAGDAINAGYRYLEVKCLGCAPLVALRATKITATDPPSTWWPGER